MSQPQFRVVFAIFPRVTQLDFTGPHQVFAQMPGATVVTASAQGGEIVADSGLRFAGITPLEEIDGCDLICVPGGFGVQEALGDEAFLAQVRRLALGARYVTSVCTGSLLLGAAGLLVGKRSACHWAWRGLLPAFGAIPDEGRVVRDGNLFTGGGITAGIDMALTVAGEMFGEGVGQRIQLSMEYAPEPPFSSGRPETAPPGVLAEFEVFREKMMPARRAAVEAASGRMPA